MAVKLASRAASTEVGTSLWYDSIDNGLVLAEPEVRKLLHFGILLNGPPDFGSVQARRRVAWAETALP